MLALSSSASIGERPVRHLVQRERMPPFRARKKPVQVEPGQRALAEACRERSRWRSRAARPSCCPSPFRMTETVPRPAGASLVMPAAAANAPPSTSDASRRISTCVPLARLRSKRRPACMLPPKAEASEMSKAASPWLTRAVAATIGERDRAGRRLRRREPEVEVQPAGEVGVDDARPGSDRRLERREGGQERPEVERVEGERASDHRQLARQHQVERASRRIAVERDLHILEPQPFGVANDVALHGDGADRGPVQDVGSATIRACAAAKARKSSPSVEIGVFAKACGAVEGEIRRRRFQARGDRRRGAAKQAAADSAEPSVDGNCSPRQMPVAVSVARPFSAAQPTFPVSAGYDLASRCRRRPRRPCRPRIRRRRTRRRAAVRYRARPVSATIARAVSIGLRYPAAGGRAGPASPASMRAARS